MIELIDNPVSLMSLGSTNEIYTDHEKELIQIPLSFRALEDNSSVLFFKKSSDISFPNFKYKINDGDWLVYSLKKISLNKDDVVSFKGDNDWITTPNDNITTKTTNFFKMTGRIEVYGNIMSLLYNDFSNPDDTPIKGKCQFEGIFYKCESLISSKNLIFPELEALFDFCYSGVFQYCESLIDSPIICAKKLGWGACSRMFSYCSSLKTPPILNADEGDYAVYAHMFEYCSSLEESPEIKHLVYNSSRI